MTESVVLLVFAVAMGIAFIWDVAGWATRMRERAVAQNDMTGALYRRIPWLNRAFGVWCIVFGIGQLIYVYGLTHGKWN